PGRTHSASLRAGFYRRVKGRRGAAVAVVATAEEAEGNRGGWWTGEPRKLAVLFYRAMTRGLEYVERGLAEYEAAYRAQSERHLRKMAARLGFILQSKTT
ncbi:MAG: hypothetical protein H0V56_06655, partial [Chthoniobacterales bacterium]|nr:hypothetical protein [Chthoniobacterales bacterium]